MENNREEGIRILRLGIERSVGREMRTPKDFEFLRECIFARLRLYISDTTLKRIWGYIPGGETRVTTLNHLSSFLGYPSWEEFLAANRGGNPMDTPSNYMLGRHISVREDLKPGQRVRLIWAPDRVCLIRYLGDCRFEVEASENTRLQSGDTFTCALILEGEPLYLDSLRQTTRPLPEGGAPRPLPPVSYVCGSRSGIRFELP